MVVVHILSIQILSRLEDKIDIYFNNYKNILDILFNELVIQIVPTVSSNIF